MSHFGIKPVSGGSPASERRTRGIHAVNTGFRAQALAKHLILFASISLNNMKIVHVIIMYVTRVRSTRGWE